MMHVYAFLFKETFVKVVFEFLYRINVKENMTQKKGSTKDQKLKTFKKRSKTKFGAKTNANLHTIIFCLAESELIELHCLKNWRYLYIQ